MSTTLLSLTTNPSLWEEFIKSCELLDEHPKKKRKFSLSSHRANDDTVFQMLTMVQQFHNTLVKAQDPRNRTTKLIDQLFWEKQVLIMSNYARRVTKLTEFMISAAFEDDQYLVSDKIVLMRPCYKHTRPEHWAYVAIHEIGHHLLCRGLTLESMARTNERVFFDEKFSARNSKTFQVNRLETEVFAWHEGMKVAKLCGFHVIDSNIDKVKANCLLSYCEIE